MNRPPLELTIFEKHPVADAYRFGPSFTPHAIVTTDKRFTDAELAAELHRSHSLEIAADSDPFRYKPGAHERASLEMETLWRFAALPHYDEDTP